MNLWMISNEWFVLIKNANLPGGCYLLRLLLHVGNTMRVKVSLYISGKVVEEVVTAMSYEDSKKVALSRNPNGRVIKVSSVI